MRSPSAELLGVQEPQILHLPADVHSLDAALETIELAEAYGSPLDESQQITLKAGMGTRADGTWAAASMGDAESRQNGKGDVIQWRELFGLTQLHEPIIHTAHEVPTAVQAFLRLVSVLESFDDLRRLVKRIRYANGEQGVEFLSGASISYKARTGAGGRGFAKIGTLIYDEAQHLQAEHVAASSPTRAVHPNPQTWFAGSSGMCTSLIWWQMRRNAILGIGKRNAFVEHTAERISVVDGEISFRRPDPWDRESWALANAAYGYRISDEFLESQLTLLGEDLFLREHCGVWDPVFDEGKSRPVKVPAEAWAATGATRLVPVEPGACTLAFDADADQRSVSVAIAAGSVTDPYVEVIEFEASSGWLPGRLVELVLSWQPLAVGVKSSGPANALVDPVRTAFKSAGIKADLLVEISGGDYRAACGGFFVDVTEGRLRRPAKGQGPLDLAVGDASEKVVGDAWEWDRRSSKVPLSPLVAATIARALLPADAPSKPALLHSW